MRNVMWTWVDTLFALTAGAVMAVFTLLIVFCPIKGFC